MTVLVSWYLGRLAILRLRLCNEEEGKEKKGDKQIQLKETIPFLFFQMRKILFFQLNVVIKEANNIIKSLF